MTTIEDPYVDAYLDPQAAGPVGEAPEPFIALDREFQVLGPPGTGKTTYLSRQVRRAVEARGPSDVLISSFTNAAAAEIGSRDLGGLDTKMVGTLHSHCYRAIGKPKVADSHIALFLEWQEKTLGGVMVNLPTEGRRALIDETSGTVYEMGGDPDSAAREAEERRRAATATSTASAFTLMTPSQAFARYQLNRAKLLPRDHFAWSAPVKAFARIWEQFKADTGMVDFTDMIERALHEVDTAPGDPSIGFFDEAQDFTPLQLALVRKWGSRMDRFVLAGDDDQVLYSFTGATPGTFAIDVPEGHRRTLPQSYRVPARVLAFAERWVSQLGDRRAAKTYKPRPVIIGKNDEGKPIYGETIAEGAVYRDDHTSWLKPTTMLKRIINILERGESVMILATSSYMLDPTIQMLRDNGIPFYNPYRVTNGLWNPLQASRGIRTADRVLAFFRPDQRIWGDEARPWTPYDLQAWIELVRASGLLTKGAKKAISEMAYSGTVPEDVLLRLFDPTALVRLIQSPKDTLLDFLADGKSKNVRYPLEIISRFGKAGITEKPRCVVGTIHSVKGGEADHVWVFPDISRIAGDHLRMGSMEAKQDAKDALVRQFYVAITRARESVTICRDAGADAMPLAAFLRIA